MRVGNRTFFLAKQGRTDMGARPEAGLYETDGTHQGTKRVMALPYEPRGAVTTQGDALYFIAQRRISPDTFDHAYDLVRTDGSVSGTASIAQFASDDVNVRTLLSTGTSLLVATVEPAGDAFVARISTLVHDASGSERVTSIFDTPVTDKWASIHLAANASGELLFGISGMLVRSNGTPGGSVVVARDQKIDRMAAAGNRFFFTGSSAWQTGASELFEVIERPAGSPEPRVRSYGAALIPSKAPEGIMRIAPLGDSVVLFTEHALYTADTAAGTLSGHSHDFSKSFSVATLGGKLYALDAYGVIVETDGTLQGTSENKVAETPTWATHKPASDLVAHDGALHFIQSTGPYTQQVVRVDTSGKSVVSSFPYGAELEGLATAGGRLFVAAGAYGKELYGLEGKRFELLEANPYGNASSDPTPVGATKDRMFFTVREDVYWFTHPDGTQESLYVTDGTAQGTKKLREGRYRDALPGTFHRVATTVGDDLCIVEMREHGRSLVCTDGSPQPKFESSYSLEKRPVVVGSGLYFARFVPNGGGQKVMRYDAGAGSAIGILSLPEWSRVHDIVARDHDIVMFIESPDPAKAGIWTSDGTAQGTIRMVPNARFLGREERVLARVGKTIYLTGPTDEGGALFKTDGTAAGTSLIKKIPFGGKVGFPEAAVIGQTVVFSVDGTGGEALWVTDGTPNGTLELADPSPGTFFHLETSDGTRAVFDTGRSIVVTDGTPQGTRRMQSPANASVWVASIPSKGFVVSSYDVKDLFSLEGAGLTSLEAGRGTCMNFRPLQIHGGLVFEGPFDGNGDEILFTDGTPGGTRVVAEVVQGPGGSSPNDLMIGIGRVWFSAEDANGDRELYSVPTSAIP